jgi:DNA-binding transcriptional LysR family regulator
MDESWMKMDLNLLKALNVLLEERNISRAADRFCVTRSAMSKTLHRLREAFNDPLLLPTAQGLVATPRAEQLAAALENAMAHFEKEINSEDFDPAQFSGRLAIAAPETFAVIVIPQLLPTLREAAPRLRLESLHLDDEYQKRLTEGSIDFAIYFDQEYPSGFVKHVLLSTTPVIWCRKDHPITRLKEVTLEDICSYPKLVSHLPAIKLTELLAILKTLEEIEVGREVLFETSHLLVALDMLHQSDAIMISNSNLFRRQTLSDAVTSLPIDHIPLFDQLRFDLCLVQHERTVKSPLHQWVVAETVRAFRQKQPEPTPLHAIPSIRRAK